MTHVASNRIIKYPDFLVQISEVFRFDEADTLVFHILLQNQTDQEIRYQRAELAVRVEPQTPDLDRPPPIYRASIVDASGTMPPQSVTSAWFAITGTRTGGRNELDPARNVFTVLVPRTHFPITSAGRPGQDRRRRRSQGRRPPLTVMNVHRFDSLWKGEFGRLVLAAAAFGLVIGGVLYWKHLHPPAAKIPRAR